MAEAKNHFISGKMNKDIEDRLIKDSEYRDALNITVGKAGENNVGSIENIKSNVLAYATSLGHLNAQPIGYVVDEKENCIYWFVTTFYFDPGVKEYPTIDDYCAILKYNQINSSFSTVLERRFLRFCHKHLITGVNIVDNYLFWTDNFNQPRRIDLNMNPDFYNYDEQLSIPRCAPYSVPTVLIQNDAGDIVNSMQLDFGVESNFLKERFVRFSYRFKFSDNSYSTIAPFTQALFIPKKFFETEDIVSTYKTTENVCMVNTINRLISKIELPSHNMYKDYFVKGIDILLKESDSTIIRSIEYIDIQDYNDDTSTKYNDSFEKVDNLGNGNIFYYEYKSNVPSKTLPESQYLRVYDKVPRLAKAQELAGSRIVYGNYLENYNLPELNYFVDFVNKDDYDFWLEYPHHSVKQSRSYQVGIVLTDIVGRSSSVIITKDSIDSHVFVPYVNTAQPNIDGEPWHGLALQINFRSPIPNPYSVRKELFTSGNNYFFECIYSDTDKLYVYSFDNNVNTELFEGDWLLGENGNHVRIFKVDGNKIYTEGKINNIYSTYYWDTDPPGKVYKYEIDKDGWHSYKIVVKQKEQEYYNVYTPAVVNYKDRSWITLHSDNINKIPRDLTMTGRQDGTYACSTILHPKVIKNRFPSIPFSGSEHNQIGSIQFTDVSFPVSVISIGTASDQKVQVTTGGTTTSAKWLYENDKDHLLAELEDNADLNGVCAYGLYVDFIPAASPPGVQKTDALKEYNIKTDGTDQYNINEAEVHLNIFETKPVESLLDIFWETSSVGLVEDLNYDISNFASDPEVPENPDLPGQILPQDILDEAGNQVDFFYESYPSGKVICIFNAVENAIPISSYQLNRVYHILNQGTIDPTPINNFTLTNIPGSPNKASITIVNPSYYENNRTSPPNPGAYYNKFKFEIKITTNTGQTVLRTFTMFLRNSNPYTFWFRNENPNAVDIDKFYVLKNRYNYFNANLTNLISTGLLNDQNGFVSGNGFANSSRYAEDIVYNIDSYIAYDYLGNVLNITPPLQLVGGGDNVYFTKIDQQYKPKNLNGTFPVPGDLPPDKGGWYSSSTNNWTTTVLGGTFDPRIKVAHVVITSNDCNRSTGTLSNGIVTNNVTNKYEFWINHMWKEYGTFAGDPDKTLHLNKYELTHPFIINPNDNRFNQFLGASCGPNLYHSYADRNKYLGTVYKFIDNEWWLCKYYFFKNNSTNINSTIGNDGLSKNGYFYMKKEFTVPYSSVTASYREGSVISSYTYGRSEYIGPSNVTLTPAANRELRSKLIVTHDEAGMANTWGTFLYRWTGNSVIDPIEYQIIVEWNTTAGVDDISKVYLLKTLIP